MFDSQGNPIILSLNKEFAKLGYATKKGKFKNQLYRDVSYQVSDGINTIDKKDHTSKRTKTLQSLDRKLDEIIDVTTSS